jgi:hypothetical protein
MCHVRCLLSAVASVHQVGGLLGDERQPDLVRPAVDFGGKRSRTGCVAFVPEQDREQCLLGESAEEVAYFLAEFG